MDIAHNNGRRWLRTKWVFLGFALVAGIALIFEHRLHLVPYLPWLLVLACPLMHLFHRHGRQGHHHRGGEDKP